MQHSEYIEIGFIARAHGLKGEVRAVFDVHDLAEYLEVEQLYLAKRDAPLQAYQIQRLRVHLPAKGEVIIQFEEVENRNQAEDLKGSTIYFPEGELPELEEGHFYYFEVVGYQVIDEKKGALGRVKGFFDGTAQDLMVMEYEGKEVLIPVTDQVVGQADHDKEVIHTDLPDGLLELYLGTDEEEQPD